ncbi:hypothetical protein GLYMA_10G035600v4 [Glycine max]|nr:hypothetical protein GLYMA_10G035600v4 [Glycine max]KAH1136568.1 hypothetical protein GYH30_026856 [Glycine max]
MFVELFFLSLFGIRLTLNMFFASLKYTSPSFVACMINTTSSLTFIIAVGLRLEVVDVKNTRGLAKVFGTVLSLIGALIMTLYEGHTIHSLQGAPLHVRGNLVHKNWIKGSILSVASCISWSLWYILQGVICGGFVIFSQFWTAEQKGPVFVSMFNPLGAILVAILAYFVFGEQLYTDSLLAYTC